MSGYDLPDVTLHGAAWGRIPTHHDGEPNVDGRAVLHVPDRQWQYEPETCRGGLYDVTAGAFDNHWYCDGQVLCCGGCGLDCA